jgi:hypothetical protein
MNQEIDYFQRSLVGGHVLSSDMGLVLRNFMLNVEFPDMIEDNWSARH